MTQAAANDAVFRGMAESLISGPQGWGIEGEVRTNDVVPDPANDTVTDNSVTHAVFATPTVPIAQSMLANSRIRASDSVVYVAATNLAGEPKPGWRFHYAGEPWMEVVHADLYRSGYEYAVFRLVVRV